MAARSLSQPAPHGPIVASGDPNEFVHEAMERQGITADEVTQQMRALTTSQATDDLKTLGIGDPIT